MTTECSGQLIALQSSCAAAASAWVRCFWLDDFDCWYWVTQYARWSSSADLPRPGVACTAVYGAFLPPHWSTQFRASQTDWKTVSLATYRPKPRLCNWCGRVNSRRNASFNWSDSGSRIPQSRRSCKLRAQSIGHANSMLCATSSSDSFVTLRNLRAASVSAHSTNALRRSSW